MTHTTGRSAPATSALLALLVAALVPAGLSAQRAPAFAGVEVRGGVVFPEGAEAGLAAMGEVDLGYVWRPELRAIAGFSRLRANIDREPGDDEGSFTANGVWLGARYDLFARSTTGAYVRGAVTIQRVRADAWDADVDALLSGTITGAGIAVGARRTLDPAGRFGGTLELRRTLLNNLAHTALEIGVRWQQRGINAYRFDPVAIAAPRPLTEPADEPPAPAPARPPAVAAADTPAAAAAVPVPAPVAQPTDAEARQVQAARDEAERARSADERAAAAQALLRQGVNRAATTMRSAAGVRETDAAFVVTLSGIAFASGAGSLSAAARSELRVLATVIAGYPGHIISIDGHTDAVGDAAANQRLSAERAAAVRAALIAEGVDPLWSAARAFGAARPIASNDSATGRAANRRVEIHIMKRRCTEPPRPSADGGLTCPG
jgi:outer membrane protein OmpA-like peptidoglycan-associated protein